MILLPYNSRIHKRIIRAAVTHLLLGKVVAYPTDTSYGLACDGTNTRAIKKLYKIKERKFSRPVHIVVPSVVYAKHIVKWGKEADILSKKFWPGALTLVLELKSKNPGLKKLTAQTGFLGVRMPANKITFDLSKISKRPITATSANPSAHLSGGYDSYSAEDIVKQFKNQKHKPDIIIDGGKLKKHKPSTIVKINNGTIEVLRVGPISKKQILKALK